MRSIRSKKKEKHIVGGIITTSYAVINTYIKMSINSNYYVHQTEYYNNVLSQFNALTKETAAAVVDIGSIKS